MGLALEGLSPVLLYLCTVIFFTGCANSENFKRYEATWQSLDTRPIPSWYDEAKFGIFMHWGLYSVPSFGNEWFWYFWQGKKEQEYVDFMKKNYPPGFSYADFVPMFTAEFFNPNEWADLVAKAGARYYVITTKHHDGWTNWKSNASWNYNAVDSGPHRDLVAALAQAFRQRTNVTFGLYFSLFEWFHPLYVKDKQSQYRTQSYVDEVSQPQLYDLINRYNPAVLWTDGDWEATSDYWRSKDFLAWLYNDSPVKDTVVVNDRWGSDCRERHGGILSTPDKYNPKVLNKRKWEDCNCVDKVSWGYRRNANIEDFHNISELITLLVEAVSCGGNLLLNVGPTKEGTIIPAFQERLLQMGEWLKLNGQAIYSTVPWRVQNDTIARNVWYTTDGENVYATVLTVWPVSSSINLGEPMATKNTVVTMIGVKDEFSWLPMSVKGGITIFIPPFFQLPCQWAWVFKLQSVV